MTVRGLFAGAIFGSLLAGAPLAVAQGFSVASHSACMAGRADAGVADPCPDGSAIHYNPAGLAFTPFAIAIGGQLFWPRGSFTPDGGGAPIRQTTGILPVPHAYLTVPVTDRIVGGIGVYGTYGLGIEWPDTFSGAFVGHRGELLAAYIQPTLAVILAPSLSVGGGVVGVLSRVTQEQALDLSRTSTSPEPNSPTFGDLGVPAGTRFANATLTGNARTLTWHFGVLWHPAERISLGMRYLGGVENRFEGGTARFEQRPSGIVLGPQNPFGQPEGAALDLLLAPLFEPGQPFGAQSASTVIDYPAQASIGVRVRVRPALKLVGDYVWTDWSVYDRVDVEVERLGTDRVIQDFRDSHGLRLGGEQGLGSSNFLRAGITYNTAAAPDETVTPLLPEARRINVHAGFGSSWGRWTGDAFAAYVAQFDRRGRVAPRASDADSAESINTGVYSASSFELGVTVTARFGGR